MEQDKDGLYKIQTYFLWVAISCIFLYFIAFNWEFVVKGFGPWLFMARLVDFCCIWIFGALSAKAAWRFIKKCYTVYETLKDDADGND